MYLNLNYKYSYIFLSVLKPQYNLKCNLTIFNMRKYKIK